MITETVIHLVDQLTILVHCWNYREYIIELLRQKPDEELSYCEGLLGRDNEGLLNYSAFHYRSAMLRRKNTEENVPIDDLLKNEWGLVTNALYTDAYNQSAWIYNRWLLNTMCTSHVLLF
jgi:geranylgeranyl transferase type-2 subunit alpha